MSPNDIECAAIAGFPWEFSRVLDRFGCYKIPCPSSRMPET
jgi:hypothetical protein